MQCTGFFLKVVLERLPFHKKIQSQLNKTLQSCNDFKHQKEKAVAVVTAFE